MSSDAESDPYHIVCAGSLLGIALHQGTSFPVGKVDFLKLYPLSFGEFLMATGNERFAELLKKQDYEMITSFTIRSVNSKKETRLYRLGEAYDRDAIYDQMRDTLRNNPQEAYRLYYEFTEKKSFGVTIQKAHFVKGNLKTAKKITGLKALYFTDSG